MAKKKSKSLEEAREVFLFKVESEGLPYALEEYGTDLAALDPEFAAIAEGFRSAIAKARAYVEKHGGEVL